MRRRLTLAVLSIGLLTALGLASSGPASAALPPVRHVFIIVLENESATTTFGSSSPAPYLSQTLTSQGAFVPNYYGIGHASLDNYIAMIGGQAPNPITSGDCPTFLNMTPGTVGADGQSSGTGCVYPPDVPTIASQLTGAGLTWRGYMDSMGADPAREAATCAHPAIGSLDNTQSQSATDQYATRHDPFVYYHSIIDNQASCDSHVVNLNALPADLASASATPNYVFITPGLCNDGHDTGCANGDPGGLPQADAFLRVWVPQITNSPAFKQDGLLLVTFDEAASSDATACCGEQPGPSGSMPGQTGPGGGRVGAVLLSPFIKAGTVSATAYNHYSMLGSVEDLFGLPHLGYAQLPGQTGFGTDIYTNYAPPVVPPPIVPMPPVATLTTPGLASVASTRPQVTLRFSATSPGSSVKSFNVQSLDLGVRHAAWRTLAAATTQTSLTFSGTRGHTYEFRVTPTDATGQAGAPVTSTTVIPSGVKPTKGHYGKPWTTVSRKGAWLSQAIESSITGSAFTLRYVGGTLTLIGETTPTGGRLRVTLDGHSRTLHLHSSKLRVRQTLGSFKVKAGTHHLKLTVRSGIVAVEGYGISARSS
jgi:hypothetical protein